MSIVVPFKRGDTFVIQGALKIDDVAVDITNVAIRAHVMKDTKRVSDLVLTKVDAVGGIYELRDDTTTRWPLGDLTTDVEYTLPSGQIVTTDTVVIRCTKDETR